MKSECKMPRPSRKPRALALLAVECPIRAPDHALCAQPVLLKAHSHMLGASGMQS